MISTTTNGEIRDIRLDRPAKRNALTWDGLETMRDSIADATEPIIYLSGAGPAFCAGADLAVIEALDARSATRFARAGQTVANALAEYDGIVIAGIDGPARGGGVELALACDIRVCTPDATLAESGVTHGLFGAWGGTVRLPRIVGDAVAMDLAVTGRVVDAPEARNLGLVSRIIDEPRSVAESLLSYDAETLVTIKHRLRDDGPPREQLAREAAAFSGLVAAGEQKPDRQEP